MNAWTFVLPATESTGSGKAGTSPPATVVGVPSSVKLQMAMTPRMRLAAASYARAASSAESKVPSHSLQLCTQQDTCCSDCVEKVKACDVPGCSVIH